MDKVSVVLGLALLVVFVGPVLGLAVLVAAGALASVFLLATNQKEK